MIIFTSCIEHLSTNFIYLRKFPGEFEISSAVGLLVYTSFNFRIYVDCAQSEFFIFIYHATRRLSVQSVKK